MNFEYINQEYLACNLQIFDNTFVDEMRVKLAPVPGEGAKTKAFLIPQSN